MATWKNTDLTPLELSALLFSVMGQKEASLVYGDMKQEAIAISVARNDGTSWQVPYTQLLLDALTKEGIAICPDCGQKPAVISEDEEVLPCISCTLDHADALTDIALDK